MSYKETVSKEKATWQGNFLLKKKRGGRMHQIPNWASKQKHTWPKRPLSFISKVTGSLGAARGLRLNLTVGVFEKYCHKEQREHAKLAVFRYASISGSQLHPVKWTYLTKTCLTKEASGRGQNMMEKNREAVIKPVCKKTTGWASTKTYLQEIKWQSHNSPAVLLICRFLFVWVLFFF